MDPIIKWYIEFCNFNNETFLEMYRWSLVFGFIAYSYVISLTIFENTKTMKFFKKFILIYLPIMVLGLGILYSFIFFIPFVLQT